MFRSPESLTHEARHSALLNTRLKAWHVAINQILHAHIRIEVMSVPAHASLGRLLYLTPRNRFVINIHMKHTFVLLDAKHRVRNLKDFEISAPE